MRSTPGPSGSSESSGVPSGVVSVIVVSVGPTDRRLALREIRYNVKAVNRETGALDG